MKAALVRATAEKKNVLWIFSTPAELAVSRWMQLRIQIIK